MQRGLMNGKQIPPEDLCNQVLNMLTTSARLSTVVIEPR
jgi:hypothetical protein